MSSLIGAMAIADLVKTTLGPKGMDKILQSVDPNDQGISITNDGATILKSVYVDNPAAKVLVGELSRPRTPPHVRAAPAAAHNEHGVHKRPPTDSPPLP